MKDNIIKILDIKINILSKTEVLEQIKNLLFSESKEQYQLITTNPEFILTAQKDEEFKNIINNSWLSVADGYGIRLAGKYQQVISNFQFPISKIKKLFIGIQVALWGILKKDDKLDIIKETITGTDLIPEICHLVFVIPASFKLPKRQVKVGIQKKFFLLGGFGDTPRLVAEKLSSFVIPSEVERSGAEPRNLLNFDWATFEESNIIEKINSFQPDVLFVALNHPRAQKWIDENLKKMSSVKLAIGVGGAFDYLSGKIKRAPESWRSNGFEWLYRLFTQPKRWKRIWQASVVFPWKVFTNSI